VSDRIVAEQTAAPFGRHASTHSSKECAMEYTITAAFLLAVVASSFAVVVFGGYGIVQLIASAL
jgi:hypothetical protein